MINRVSVPTTIVFILLMVGCQASGKLQRYGSHFKRHQDYHSLRKAVALTPIGTDKATLRKLLGEPIDMGFDFRYLIDSVGPKGCSIGAVFHFDANGTVDDKWLDEICE